MYRVEGPREKHSSPITRTSKFYVGSSGDNILFSIMSAKSVNVPA